MILENIHLNDNGKSQKIYLLFGKMKISEKSPNKIDVETRAYKLSTSVGLKVISFNLSAETEDDNDMNHLATDI